MKINILLIKNKNEFKNKGKEKHTLTNEPNHLSSWLPCNREINVTFMILQHRILIYFIMMVHILRTKSAK